MAARYPPPARYGDTHRNMPFQMTLDIGTIAAFGIE